LTVNFYRFGLNFYFSA